MPSRARLDEFIAVVESGDHAGAIERYYTEDASMQENAAPPRVGRDLLVAQERGMLARMSRRVIPKQCRPRSRATMSPFTGFSNSPTNPEKCIASTKSRAAMARRPDFPRAILLRSVETEDR